MKEHENFPQNVCIRLNRKCNLSCAFCLASNEQEELSTDQIQYALKYLKLHGIKKACLGGGEPTLREDFMKIVKFCITLGLKTTIYSNLIDIDNIIDDLIQYPISITASIHGNQAIHDLLTRPQAYESTYRNINTLISKNIEVAIHSVLMKENYTCVEEVIQNAIAVGIKKISFQTLIPRGRGAELFKDNEKVEDIINMLHALYPLQDRYAKYINIKFMNLYEMNYYVLETDGCLYSQKANESSDTFIRRII